MSASETRHSLSPNRPITSRRISAPPRITSWRPAGRPGRLPPRRHRLGAEDVAPAGDRLQREDGVVDAAPVVSGQPQLHAGQGRDGPGQAHQTRPGREVRQRRDALDGPVELHRHRFDRVGHLARRRWIPGQEALGQPHAPDLERLGRHPAPRRGGDLRRPAADVHHHDRADFQGQVGGGTGVGQPALLGSREQLGGDADDLRRGDEERVAVAGVAHGRRGDQARPLDAVCVYQPAELAQYGEGPLECLGRQHARLVHALAEPGDPHLADLGVPRGPGHEQAGRIGPAVDGGDSSRSRHGPSIPERPGLSDWGAAPRAAGPSTPLPGRPHPPTTRPDGRGGT